MPKSRLLISSSIPAMHDFVNSLTVAPKKLTDIAFAYTIAEIVGADEVRRNLRLAAEDQRANDEYSEGLKTLVLESREPAKLLPYLKLHGEHGWFFAGRLAERAYLSGRPDLMEKAIERLHDAHDFVPVAVSLPWEITLAEMALRHLRFGEWQIDRGAESVKGLSGLYQQRAILDWSRLALKVKYRRPAA